MALALANTANSQIQSFLCMRSAEDVQAPDYLNASPLVGAAAGVAVLGVAGTGTACSVTLLPLHHGDRPPIPHTPPSSSD